MSEHISAGKKPVSRRVWIWFASLAVGICGGVAIGITTDWIIGTWVIGLILLVWLGLPPSLTALGVQWSEGLPLAHFQRLRASELETDQVSEKMNTATRPGQEKQTDQSQTNSPFGTSLNPASKFQPDGTVFHDDLVRLADLLPAAISAPHVIRQLASQAEIAPGQLADEEVSAERLWPDLLEISERLGKVPRLLVRIQKKLGSRVDVSEIRDIISRLLNQ